MTIYKLPDGTEFNLSDPVHKEERSVGWYIIGNDLEVKVKDEARADPIEIYNRDRFKYYLRLISYFYMMCFSLKSP